MTARPTHTVLVPNRKTLDRMLEAFIDAKQTFTVEPSGKTWLVGVFPEGLSIVKLIFGETVDAGTLGEWKERQSGC